MLRHEEIGLNIQIMRGLKGKDRETAVAQATIEVNDGWKPEKQQDEGGLQVKRVDKVLEEEATVKSDDTNGRRKSPEWRSNKKEMWAEIDGERFWKRHRTDGEARRKMNAAFEWATNWMEVRALDRN